ncbi:helix-turn-helix domain-containing protein [Actinomycetota bacterium]
MKYSNKKFNIALKEILDENKVKLRGLAGKTKYNFTYFSKLKNRIKQPPIKTIEVIAKGLNIPPEYFLEYRVYKIKEYLLKNPELIEPVMSYIKALKEKKELKVAESKEPFE